MGKGFRSSVLAAAIALAFVAAGHAQSDPAADARAALQAQVAAWNRGDLDGALAAYWNSPEIAWVGKSGVGKGYNSFADAMRSDFSDPSKMGVYQAEVLDGRTVGPDAALLVLRWSITRDGRRIMGGVSTQLWRKKGERWVAVLEHAS